VFFPEGTFTRRAGLLASTWGHSSGGGREPAGRARTLRGVRTLLRGDQCSRPHAGQRRDRAADQAFGTDFGAMLSLRDAARAAMLKHVGEPDLGALEKPPGPAA